MVITILGIGGSVRSGSTAMLALQMALAGAQEERKAILTLLDATREAQGVILASPTYHNTISGTLKNALDFMELLKDDRPPRLEGKVVGLVSVQGGTSGTGNNTLTTFQNA